MKWIRNIILLLVLSVTLIACQSEQVVSFSDQALEEAIRTEIGESEDDITESDVEGITELDLAGLGISNLAGIEVFDSLEKLFLQDNTITDFSLLEDLEKLEEVNVAGNPFEDDQQQVALLEKLSDQGIEVVKVIAIEVVGDADGPGGFLWKVVDGDTVVYLQGTVHIGTEEFYPFNEKIEKAYAESDVVVPEIDMDNIDEDDIEGLNEMLGTYQDGTTLADHIPEALYTRVSTEFSELGIPMEMIDQFKPWIVANTIQQMMGMQLGYFYGVDEYFLSRAAEDGKEIIALETVEEQLSILAGTSPEFQIELLEESLMDLTEYEQQMHALFDAYLGGDKDELLALLLGEEDDTELSEEEQAYMEALNDQRNYQMAEDIMAFLKEDTDTTYFVIVGSLHLIMEPHIVSILEEEGYEVERVH